MKREMPLEIAMPFPKSVYELLGLLSSRGGRMVDTEIPEHLRNALHICRREPPQIVPVPVVGAIPVTKRPTIWKLTSEGEAVLALHLETEAESGEQLLPPKEPPPPRLTVDLARMGAVLDGVYMDCNSKQGAAIT
jgi:hypothetical protein